MHFIEAPQFQRFEIGKNRQKSSAKQWIESAAPKEA
jgi:hypothetical protein